MKHFDLTQPTPEEQYDELIGHINELTDYIFNLETILLFAIKGLQHPEKRV